jgi:hypothetical protein
MMHEGDEFHETDHGGGSDDKAPAIAGAADHREPRKFFPRVKMLLSFDFEPVRTVCILGLDRPVMSWRILFRKPVIPEWMVARLNRTGCRVELSSVSPSFMLSWMLLPLVLPRLTYTFLLYLYLQLLKGLLQVVEASGCALVPTATTTNAWRVAFDATYNTVLSDFSIPSGKNRYHKFRDKIVEIWKAMEESQEFFPGNHKLYALAHTQYGYFSRVTDERKAAINVDDRKQAPSASPKDTPKAKSKSVPAATSTATPASGTKKRPAVGAPPTTSPAVATTQRASAGLAAAARAYTSITSNNIDKSEWPEGLLSKLETITVLLQTANNNPQMPPKLPILLNDVHRIRVRTTDPGELAIIKPYYLDLLNNYLQAIEYKIRTDSVVLPHPAALMVDLEGMDLLRQGLRNDPEMLDLVQTTYQRVLIKYLKMVNPRIPAMAQQKKRPRET